ncbi:lipase family protein [Nocardia sp. CDC159]|uniref:Lipase family protein n=1 Tax=Nocardia pulmonis TaxID=2951408 RepID=A0A9X2EAR8_9NOCA|nr:MULTISPECIES: lipase family protein [Nocardia]MCM6775938.1 lipase family protein [Nocardia pulmonis]MCM6788086.1 lipase family protein [Nocardia sp. CDC159]
MRASQVTFRRPLGLLAAAVAIAGSLHAISSVDASAQPPLPVDDPFYAQPDSLAGRAMGEVIDSRPVTLPDFPSSVAFSAWQLKYVSQDTKGKPWTTMAIVLRPERRVEPPVLISDQAWINSLNSRCNPSYLMRLNANRQGTIRLEEQNIAAELERGWTVVVPDFLGPEPQFTAGYVEGRNTLDGIRAAENFAPAGLLGTATPVLLYGYSGGSRGTEFAAELAPTYAPELNIRAVAAGGLPTDLAGTARLVNGGFFSSLTMVAALGIDRAYPELNIRSFVRDPALIEEITGSCYVDLGQKYAFTRLQDYTVNGVWPLDTPAIAAVVESLRAGRYGTPAAPLYLVSAVIDEIATVPDTDRLVADYCARGVDITYTKFPVAEHVSAEFESFSGSLDWLAQRLSGAATTSTCGAPGNVRMG